ncbi:hypothetical protein CWO91_32665 [Bradyrhizobium genosp. SA-3]|nr:hypothetical protein CWO91_32665 [Bradyrhizobium genosp. SA-3]
MHMTHFVISEIRLLDAVPSVVHDLRRCGDPMGSARTSFAFATEQCARIEVAVLRCIDLDDREGAELLAERG